MKRPSPKPAGFTLVELLLVITIITILAGLTFAMLGFAERKAKTERAKGEVNALSLAIEAYKIDNGDYPRDPNTDAATVDPQRTPLTTISTASTPVMLSSVTLYTALSGDINLDGIPGDTVAGSKSKIYFDFKKKMLHFNSANTVDAIVDPFRNAYGYSTIGSTTNSNGIQAGGYNPTFDLWSTADDSTVNQNIWIKNW